MSITRLECQIASFSKYGRARRTVHQRRSGVPKPRLSKHGYRPRRARGNGPKTPLILMTRFRFIALFVFYFLLIAMMLIPGYGSRGVITVSIQVWGRVGCHIYTSNAPVPASTTRNSSWPSDLEMRLQLDGDTSDQDHLNKPYRQKHFTQGLLQVSLESKRW